jgi:hypothetical protein
VLSFAASTPSKMRPSWTTSCSACRPPPRP